jgi:hypothetical protein
VIRNDGSRVEFKFTDASVDPSRAGGNVDPSGASMALDPAARK